MVLDFQTFLARFKHIQSRGFIPGNRNHDTGIGKTLEDLLEIKENNVAGPDFDIYELKSQRKNTNTMLTLFTKAPQPRGANALLLETFGYPKRHSKLETFRQTGKLGAPASGPIKKELHVTVTALKPNSVGLTLERRDNRIYIANQRGVEVYYEEEYLKEAFERKYSHHMIYILAETKKEGKAELFRYTDAYMLSDFSFAGFSELISNGVMKLDLRMGHYANGKPHDHGTGFRVFPRDFPHCFKKIEKIA